MKEQSMIQQMSRLMEYLDCLPVQTFSLDNMEADDVISYVANRESLPVSHNVYRQRLSTISRR